MTKIIKGQPQERRINIGVVVIALALVFAMVLFALR